jgi:hypothetical protein
MGPQDHTLLTISQMQGQAPLDQAILTAQAHDRP